MTLVMGTTLHRARSQGSTYDKYSPVTSWDRKERGPRILLYVKQGLQAEQKLTIPGTRDVLWVEVNGFPVIACYRQPRTDTVIDYLTNLQVPPNCLIGGDLNAQHLIFDPGVEGRDRGRDLLKWIDRAGLIFSGRPGEATNKHGHVIDHVYSEPAAFDQRMEYTVARPTTYWETLSLELSCRRKLTIYAS